MTTYTPISDAETQTGAIVSQSLMRALRDNTRALAEDDVSVPPVDTIKRLGRQNRIVVGAAADDGSTKLQVDGAAIARGGVAFEGSLIGPGAGRTVMDRLSLTESRMSVFGPDPATTGAHRVVATSSDASIIADSIRCHELGLDVRGVPLVWPAANALGALSNDGAGNLTWILGGAVAAFYAGINNATALAITAAVAATANRMHNVSGIVGDYIITLPVAPAVGTVVGLNVLPFAAANKQYRLDAGVGVRVCGRTRFLVLLHANVALLRWDGAQWNPLVLSLDTPWVSGGAITITGTTTNPTKGATSTDKITWRRVANELKIRYEFRQTGAGTAGTGTYALAVPTTIGAIDIALVTPMTVTGDSVTAVDASGTSDVGGGSLTNSTTYTTARLQLRDTTTLIVTSVSDGGRSLWSSTANQLSAAGIRFSATAELPMVGW